MAITTGSPHHNDIRRRAQNAADKATHDFYVRQCEEMADEFGRIVKLIGEGETVVIRDQWGDTVTVVAAPDTKEG